MYIILTEYRFFIFYEIKYEFSCYISFKCVSFRLHSGCRKWEDGHPSTDLPRLLGVFCPPLSRKRGDIKSHSSVCLSVPLSVRLSVTKTLTWLISSELLKIEH